MADDLMEQHLGIARMIAYEHANIPGASVDEVASEMPAAMKMALP